MKLRLSKRSTSLCIISILASCSLPFGLTQPSKSLPARTLQKKVHRIRAITSSSRPDDFENEAPIAVTRRQRTGMSLALTSMYFSVMAAKCALPATLSLLTDPKVGLTLGPAAVGHGHSDLVRYQQQLQQVFATILFLSTSAIAFGKLLLGPIIDHFGGVLSLQVSLIALATLLGTISVSHTVSTFAVCWILVDFIFSSCWAASINAIHQSFPQNEWPKQVARLAAAARSGNAAAFALFASLLSYSASRWTQSWRPVFVVSAILQLVPVALLTVFGQGGSSRASIPEQRTTGKPARRQSLPQQSTQEKSGPWVVLKRQIRTLEFWCHLTSRSMLMVFASFLLFVPTLMQQVYKVSSATAARVGSLYALGCLVSVMAGSGRYAQLSRRGKITAIATLLGLATSSSIAQLGHVTGTWLLSPRWSAVSMLVWGLGFAVPFYIPPSLFALKRGGVESSATIADVFDIGGFALLAAFNGFVAGIDHASKAAWIPVFLQTTIAAAISLASLCVAVWKEE